MNDAVVDVLTGGRVDMTYYGVVESTAETVDDEKAAVQKEMTVTCTDGVTRTFTVKDVKDLGAGTLVSVDMTSGGISVKRLNQKTTRGKVSQDASTLGKLRIAADAQILDTSKEGDSIVVDPARMAGHTLKQEHVRYYSLNRNSEIDCLILNDATGDTWSYGYLINASDNAQNDGSGSRTANYSYTYMLDRTRTRLETGVKKYQAEGAGGVAIRYDSGGEVKDMKTIASARLTELGTFTARADNKTYDLAENLQVYLKEDGVYYLTERDAIDAENYTLTGYYDDFGCPAGGQIRVITAVEK